MRWFNLNPKCTWPNPSPEPDFTTSSPQNRTEAGCMDVQVGGNGDIGDIARLPACGEVGIALIFLVARPALWGGGSHQRAKPHAPMRVPRKAGLARNHYSYVYAQISRVCCTGGTYAAASKHCQCTLAYTPNYDITVLSLR